jgi:hypothetical protein
VTVTRDLFTPRRFVDAIDRIAERRASTPSSTRLHECGVSLTTIQRNSDRVARLLVGDLLATRLAERPGRTFVMKKDGKERRLYEFSLVEMILQDAVAAWLSERSAASLSARLYSYRTGTSYHRALADFARYVRRSQRTREHPRGLYVLRRDVHAYFDSVPVRDDAPLWAELDRLIDGEPNPMLTRSLVARAVRPLLADGNGTAYRLACGIPTGSPVANVVANLYLRSMDEELSRVPDAFYARYGDDILVAHPDAEAAASMGRVLASYLTDGEVTSNPDKTRDVYLNSAGRAAPAAGSFVGAAAVEFLGHRITAHGTVALSRRKTRALLDALRSGARNATKPDVATLHGRVRRVVQTLNALLNPRSAASHPYAGLLHTTVTDRPFLHWLDHELALITLEAALGTRRVSNLRQFPPRVLRSMFGLRSLVAARNRDGR